MTVRIVLADDHAVFRAGLRALLTRESDFEVVGEAERADDVVAQIEATRCDVLVLDLTMPGTLSGAQVAEAVLRRFRHVRIVVLTMHEDQTYVREMFRVGVHGFVLKRAATDEVIRAVRAAVRGEFHVDASLGGQAVSALVAPPTERNPGRLDLLTPREIDVCRLLALGYTNGEVARQLFISERTVETHRNNVMSKLGLKSRAELVRFALDHDLVR